MVLKILVTIVVLFWNASFFHPAWMQVDKADQFFIKRKWRITSSDCIDWIGKLILVVYLWWKN